MAQARHDDEHADDTVVVMPVVVTTRTFDARPSALPDAEEFVLGYLADSGLEPADIPAINDAIRDAILQAAAPEIGSFQVTVREFPDGTEVEVLASADDVPRTSAADNATAAPFADWLVDTLRRRGLSKEVAARQLGVSVRTVSRWMRGETEPRLRDLRRVEGLLGYPRDTSP